MIITKSLLEDVKIAMDQFCVTSMMKSTPSQAFGHSLILKQIILEGSITDLNILQVENYLNQISFIGLNTLSQTELYNTYSNNDLAYILETINCLSEICLFLVERSLQEVPMDDDDISRKPHFREDENFHNSPIFQASSLFEQIMQLSEKVLDIDIANTSIKMISFSQNPEFNKTLNKAKRYSIDTLNLILTYIFNLKKTHSHNFSPQEAEFIGNFIKRFEEHIKFFLTQMHQVVVGMFSSDNALTYEVCS